MKWLKTHDGGDALIDPKAVVLLHPSGLPGCSVIRTGGPAGNSVVVLGDTRDVAALLFEADKE